MQTKNKYIHEGMDQIANEKSIARHNKIGARLKLHLIKAEHLINTSDMHKGYNFCRDVTYAEIEHYKDFTESNVLKYFNGMEKWKLLLEVIHSSSCGKVVYKEELSRKTKCSHKTLTKYINECIEAGYFIYLDPINQKIQDKRIINLRPSEDLIVAFINYSVARIENSIKLLKSYSKYNVN